MKTIIILFALCVSLSAQDSTQIKAGQLLEKAGNQRTSAYAVQIFGAVIYACRPLPVIGVGTAAVSIIFNLSAASNDVKAGKLLQKSKK